MGQNVFLQLFIDFFFARRAAHHAEIIVFRAAADTERSASSLMPLADRDLLLQFLQQAFFLQAKQCGDKACVAGAAGIHFVDRISDGEHSVLPRQFLLVEQFELEFLFLFLFFFVVLLFLERFRFRRGNGADRAQRVHPSDGRAS